MNFLRKRMETDKNTLQGAIALRGQDASKSRMRINGEIALTFSICFSRPIFTQPYAIFLLAFFLTVKVVLGQTANPQKGYALLIAVPTVKEELVEKNRNLKQPISFESISGTQNDVLMIRYILLKEGYSPANIIMLGIEKDYPATLDKVKNAFNEIGSKIKSNDKFIFYFSGHGFQLADTNKDEDDKLDEAMVLYDDLLVDDEVNEVYKKMYKTSQNTMIVDACHSGSSYKFKKEFFNIREMNEDVGSNACYVSSTKLVDEGISMIYIGASIDENPAYANYGGSFFTQTLYALYTKPIWKNLSPEEIVCQISKYMPKPEGTKTKTPVQCSIVGKPNEQIFKNYLFKL